jgi:hypothetical protein
MSGYDKHFSSALNWHIHAEQKISVMNETKRYKIWAKPNIFDLKNFRNLPPNFIQICKLQ